MKPKLWFSLGLFWVAVGCNEATDKFEFVDKLRGVGISTNTPIVATAQTVDLEIVALLPKDQTITLAEPYVDTSVEEFRRLTLTLNDDATLTPKGALSVYTRTAQVEVPTVAAEQLAQLNNLARLRFGVQLAAGDDVEIMVDDILVVPAGDPSLEWVAPSLRVEAPEDSVSVTMPYTLTAQVEAHQEERIKTIWFISSGALDNSEAWQTEWSKAQAGEQTVVMATFAQRSRFFSYEARMVTVTP